MTNEKTPPPGPLAHELAAFDQLYAELSDVVDELIDALTGQVRAGQSRESAVVYLADYLTNHSSHAVNAQLLAVAVNRLATSGAIDV